MHTYIDTYIQTYKHIYKQAKKQVGNVDTPFFLLSVVQEIVPKHPSFRRNLSYMLKIKDS